MSLAAHSLLAVVVILSIALLLSARPSWIRPRVVGSALATQLALAFIALRFPPGMAALSVLAGGVSRLLGYAQAGTDFLFAPLAGDKLGAMFAIQALPIIIFFSALVAICNNLGILRLLIKFLGGVIQFVIGIGKVESVCVAANIFVGQSESPLLIRSYLPSLDQSRLFMVMTSGMAGVAGTILAAYVSMGIRPDYLLTACFMSAPGSIVMAKIMMPDDPASPADASPSPVADHGECAPARESIIEAAVSGAHLGTRLAVAVGSTVLAFVGLVAMANGIIGGLAGLVGLHDVSFQTLLAHIFSPVFRLLGMPTSEANAAGQLFGEKIILNEFVAYIHLGQITRILSPRSLAIVTFSLCGFANLTSIAIQMAVTGSLAPDQRPMLARLGLRAVIAGSLTNLMSAAIAGGVLAL